MPSRPNVLWICGEDLYPDLGCYGELIARTPNIDRLAEDGTVYRNAFVTCPVCSPSRSAIITGRYQTSFGAHQHRSKREAPLPETIRLITDYFRDAGYFTCNSSGPPDFRAGKEDFNFFRENAFDGVRWSERQPGQPFYAQINILDTHRTFSRDLENPVDPDRVDLPPYYPDHPLVRRDWANYLESIQVFDRKVGKVLRALDADGLSENTIVFLISDHGRAHIRDKQFLYDGGIRVPCIVRWPGRIAPGASSGGLVSAVDFAPTALSLAGLPVPEGMEGQVFAGDSAKIRKYVVAARDRCDGTLDRIRCVRSKRWKYIRNFHPDRPWMQFNGYKQQAYPLWTLLPVLASQKQLTEAQARFLAPSRPVEELYDLSIDPHELCDLSQSEVPECVRGLAVMRSRLDAWITRYGDMGAEPEDPEVVAEAVRKMKDDHSARMIGHGLAPDVAPEDHLRWWEGKLEIK